MTEAEWLVSTDIKSLTEAARSRCSDRRLRLFSVGCCIRLWEFLETSARQAVVTAEGYADGLVDEYQLATAHVAATRLHDSTRRNLPPPIDEWTSDLGLAGPAIAIYLTSRDHNQQMADLVSECLRRLRAAIRALEVASTGHQGDNGPLIQIAPDVKAADEVKERASLLRDIVGNPFRPVAFLPEWRTSTTLALSRQMYDSRDFSAMPILADALADAGCADEAILTHCRGPGPHVRGCHVVDACLSKS